MVVTVVMVAMCAAVMLAAAVFALGAGVWWMGKWS